MSATCHPLNGKVRECLLEASRSYFSVDGCFSARKFNTVRERLKDYRALRREQVCEPQGLVIEAINPWPSFALRGDELADYLERWVDYWEVYQQIEEAKGEIRSLEREINGLEDEICDARRRLCRAQERLSGAELP